MAETCPFDITPLEVSKIERNPTLKSLTYTNQDYGTLKNKQLQLIQQKYFNEFNDFTESSIAIMLIELFAFVGDQLSFKIDQIANELNTDTVTEMTNMLKLAKFVGFIPTPPMAARSMFTISINNPLTVDIPITTPLKISYLTANNRERTFELFPSTNNTPIYGEPITITAGSIATNYVIGIEGETFHKTGVGTGEPWQQIVLSGQSVLAKSVKVVVDGSPWEETNYFSDSHPRPEFKIEYTSSYGATLIFGNNHTGLIPPKGSSIAITYRIGGGACGNVITGSIDKSIPLNAPGMGHAITANIRNYTRGEGGYDGDTIEDIRLKLPLYLKSQNRCVSASDYQSFCDTFSSPTSGLVGKSVAVLRNYGCAGNIIDIYLLARNGNLGLMQPGDALKTELARELKVRKMFSDYVCLRDGEVIEVDINIELTLDKINNRMENEIRGRINLRLAHLFGLQNCAFGNTLKDSDIVKSLADIRELEQIDVSFTTVKGVEMGYGTTSIVTCKFNEIVRPDNVSINFTYK